MGTERIQSDGLANVSEGGKELAFNVTMPESYIERDRRQAKREEARRRSIDQLPISSGSGSPVRDIQTNPG